MSKTKNLTVTLSSEEHEDLDFLVNYFQEQSISTVTKSDVIKFMINQFKTAVDKDRMGQVRRLINNGEK